MGKYILREGESLGYSVESVIDANEYSIDITLPLVTNETHNFQMYLRQLRRVYYHHSRLDNVN